MIYTVGHRESYERLFAEDGAAVKRGRDGDYPGGSAWQTVEEALACCPDDYAVYGLLADWEHDTAPSSGGTWHDLLRDAELVQLEGVAV